MISRFCLITALCAFVAAGAATVAAGGDDPRLLLIEARAKVSVGKTAEAITLYRRAIALLPTDAAARKELARLLTRSKETRAEAEQVYAEAVARAPQDVDLAIERAANLAFIGDGVNATLEYRRAFEIAPDNQDAVRGFIQQVSRLGAAPVAIQQRSERLATAPDDLASRLLLAELLRSEARYNEALDQFWLAQRAAPDNVVALRGAAEAWLALGYFGRADDLFAQANARGSRARSLADRARVLIAAGRPEAALRLLNTIPAEIESEPSALIAVADGYRALGQSAQERATLERVLALHPGEGIPALERLARVRLEMGDKAASRAACEQLLMLDPRSATGILGLGLTSPAPPAQQAPEVREASPTRRAGADRELGEAALFWQQSTPALTSLRRALDVWPDSPRLLLAVGQALIRAKDTEGAATLFARVAMANGRRPDALFGLAQAEMMRRNPQRALAIYRDLLRLDPNNFRALSEEAAALQLTGDDEQAAVLLTDLARRAPESVSINARLRESLFAIGRSYRSSAPEPAALRVVGASKDQATPAMPSPVEPVLGAGDAIRVRVVGRPEFGAEARVDVDGAIRLPFLKEALSARCLTERELSAQISRRVGAQLAGAAFEVSITELRRAPLVLAGAVHLPGSFNVRVALDLRESLMLASGATTRAGRSIFILRGTSGCDLQPTDKTAGQIETYERAAAEEGRIKLAQPVRPGDAVIVPERDAAFITGAVARPSIVSARENLTLLAAVRQLGGTLSEARRDNVRLLRLLPDGASRQQFIINLNEIEQHRVGDVKLLPGDIVEVPSNNGKGWASSFAALLQRSLLNTGSLAPTSPLRAVVTGASPAKQ